MKRKVVLLKESKNAKRVHPLNADELKGVMGGIIVDPAPLPQPQPPGASGPSAPDRDWGWWW